MTTGQGRWKFRQVAEDQVSRPPGWGDDPLTEFLQAVEGNTYLTVRAHKAAVKRLRAGIELFETGSNAYFTERRKNSATDSYFESLDRAFPLLMATYQSIYAALTLTFSSQMTEAAKPLRGAIETALYAYYFYRDPKAYRLWESRPTADDLRVAARANEARKARSKVGRELSATRILAVLHEKDAKLADLTSDLYEHLIDVGGHFNMSVFQTHTRFTRLQNPDRQRVDYRLIGATASERTKGLELLSRVTSCTLRVFQIVFRDFWQPAKVSDQLTAFTRSIT